MALIDRGLDLSDLHETSQEEIVGFRDFYRERFGYPLPAFEMWLENRPDVLKAYRLQASQSRSAPWTAVAMMHLYAIHGYEDGILYEIKNCQGHGLTKKQVLEGLAVAFIHAGPRGMRFVATSSREYLRDYEERDTPPTWPDNWDVDPDAFHSGVDFSNPDLTDAERARLEGWYETTLGEIPASVAFMVRHRPSVLKAYRCRWENAIQDGLPKQMMPYLMMQFNVTRGFSEGIREAALLGRAFGMGLEQVVDALVWGVGYGGGLDSVYAAEASISEVFNV